MIKRGKEERGEKFRRSKANFPLNLLLLLLMLLLFTYVCLSVQAVFLLFPNHAYE
jgi:hypothetical protein